MEVGPGGSHVYFAVSPPVTPVERWGNISTGAQEFQKHSDPEH